MGYRPGFKKKESLAHTGNQTMDHQAHSLFTILTTVPRAFNKTEMEIVMGDGHS